MKINLRLAVLLLLIAAMLTPTQAMRIFFPQYNEKQLQETEDALDRHLAHMAKKKADHETGGWATEYSLKESYEKRIAFLKQQIADLSK
ncbi:MAG: hypothetical protein II170_00070 [Bacteroidaceae bacterium]|nr:hypothetical protein [Bacteroidaceae bacterium]